MRSSPSAEPFGALAAFGSTLASASRAASAAVAEPPRTRPARRITLSSVFNALGLVLSIAAVVAWALFLRPQSLGGPAGYVMVSGTSMLPRYHTGDVVLVERKAAYHVGQVIAYRVPKSDPMVGAQVIHRIIGGNAKEGFVVQGDNRTAPDIWRPKPSDIVGAKALRIPDGIIALQFMRSPMLLGLLAAMFVFVYVAGAAVGAGSEPEPEPDDPDLTGSA